MEWEVTFHDAFDEEFENLSETVQDAILAGVSLLGRVGSELKRPHVDTLNGSRQANMKELRCKADDGMWRVAFAFDPERKAVLLVAGDKTGVSEKRFYRKLIDKADERFDEHLALRERRK